MSLWGNFNRWLEDEDGLKLYKDGAANNDKPIGAFLGLALNEKGQPAAVFNRLEILNGHTFTDVRGITYNGILFGFVEGPHKETPKTLLTERFVDRLRTQIILKVEKELVHDNNSGTLKNGDGTINLGKLSSVIKLYEAGDRKAWSENIKGSDNMMRRELLMGLNEALTQLKAHGHNLAGTKGVLQFDKSHLVSSSQTVASQVEVLPGGAGTIRVTGGAGGIPPVKLKPN